MNQQILNEALAKFVKRWGEEPTAISYAPGRVEVLGNHTDYNEGFVLSAGINYGTFFLAGPAEGNTCTLRAGDVEEEITFDCTEPGRSEECGWSNYVRGVLAGLCEVGNIENGFNGLFFGDVPIGSGLSSSAALEISSGLALAKLYGLNVSPMDMAKIGQASEHNYAGVKCGLMDQISSLYAEEDKLVMSDFRSLDIETVDMGHDACFVVCNTGVKHALVDGEYNERREKCEEAAVFFKGVLDHPVAALRDVSWEEWQARQGEMEPVAAKRSAHPVGENDRVLRGREALHHNDLEAFGKLMFESHESSINYFENSCPELDFLVKTARSVPGALGARLSGGGFGGSVVVLTGPRDAETVSKALANAYAHEYGQPCENLLIRPSEGARLVGE